MKSGVIAVSALLLSAASGWAQEEVVQAQESAEVANEAAEAVSIEEVVADAAPLEPVVLDWPVSDVTDVVCPFSFDYEPGDMTCGFIEVPENRTNPDTRFIQLLYVRIASTAEDEAEVRADPAIYLTGGPGVMLETYADRLREHDILEQRDLYILEHRGIGNSGDFCEYFDTVRRDLAWGDTIDEAARNQAERMRECFRTAAAAGVDLAAYSTVENARDVRSLRQALGYEDWNVWGISYGSTLGQMVLREDAEGTRAMVIDAIAPLDMLELMRIGRWVNVALDKIFESCADDAVCDGLRPRLDAAIAQMQENPVVVEVDNPEVYPDGQVRFGPELLLFPAFSMMYEQSAHPAIPAVTEFMVRAVENQDQRVFELIANGDLGGGTGFSAGMANAIRCNDGFHASAAEVAADDLAENPEFAGTGFIESSAYVAQVCVDEGLSPANYGMTQSDRPVLVVNGAWDPVTPPEMAHQIMPGLTNARYIEVPFAGHGPTRSEPECAGPFLNAFFDNPDPQAADASCFETVVPEPEFVSLYQTDAIIRAGLIAVDDPANLAPAGAWAGVSLFVLLLSAFIYPLAFLARLIGRRPAGEMHAATGGARWLAWGAALTGLAFPALMGLAGYKAFDISEFAIVAGLSKGPAMLGAWLGLASGVLGLLALIQIFRSRASGSVRIGTLTGVALTGLAAVSLMVFAFVWDLSPF
ncbi:alpha/beta fold hydrolase [Hyphobacterium sp.]|uniref:alpha/beta fold hydrolase n=1 Tax=Hyphobacterium sp. TaxID=2004662 RepID=UPI003BAC36B0